MSELAAHHWKRNPETQTESRDFVETLVPRFHLLILRTPAATSVYAGFAEDHLSETQ